MAKFFTFFFFFLLIMNCKPVHEQKESDEHFPIQKESDFFDGAKVFEYFNIYTSINIEQQNQIHAITRYYYEQWYKMSPLEQSQHQGRFIIKLISHIIRDVLSMEQAKEYISNDPRAQELFGHELN